MDELWGWLFTIGIVGVIIYLFVVYVLPILLGIAAAILAVFGVIGLVVGLFFAVRNFIVSIRDVIRKRSALGGFKDRDTMDKVRKEAPGGNYSKFFFEECARRSYFFGPAFADIWSIIKGAFLENFSTFPDFSRGDRWYTKILFVFWGICQLLAQFVAGTLVTALIAAVMLLLAFVITVILYVFFGIVLLIENLYLKMKSVSFRCQTCTETYKLPVYVCPKCQIRHVRLRPGRFGVFRRKCVCGSVLPLTVSANGYTLKMDGAAKSYRKEKFKMDTMTTLCPNCGKVENVGLTHPVSIALIGGSSAGKTTFKVAFLKQFINDEIVKYDIKESYPKKEYEQEMQQIARYYSGIPIPPTQFGTEYDIITFSFRLSHSKFGVDRLIHIYDMPGEAFSRGQVKGGWQMYTFSDGAVFLIDPYSLERVKEGTEEERRGSSMGISMVSMNELVQAMVSQFRSVKAPTAKSGKFKVPIALTINKADSRMLKKLVGDEAVKKLMESHPEEFTDYYDTMDYLCRCFLSDNGCDAFIANLDMNFETVHFFSSSPIGSVPKGVQTPFYPINVLPIMQWLMLRTDKQLASVWKPEIPVPDVSVEKRERYKTMKHFYDQEIAAPYAEMQDRKE